MKKHCGLVLSLTCTSLQSLNLLRHVCALEIERAPEAAALFTR